MSPPMPLTMSRTVFGTMRLTGWGANYSLEEASKVMEACMDVGLTTWDTADIYGHYDVEELLGNILALHPDWRSRVQLLTKCGITLPCDKRPDVKGHTYNSSEQHIIDSVNRSLENMKTDYIDLLMIHRPDPLTDPYTIAKVFKSLQDSGKVHHFGVSNYTPSQLRLLHQACQSQGVTLEVNQIELSLLHNGPIFDGTIDTCVELGIKVMAWSPFGGGRLFAKDGEDAAADRIKPILADLAVQYNAMPSQLALAWVHQLPCRPHLILGSTQIERIQDLAVTEVTLSREHWYKLLEAAWGHDIP